MTMAYIIALNPNLLTGFGKDTMPELWNGVLDVYKRQEKRCSMHKICR